MVSVLVVAAGGAIGAVVRFLLSGFVMRQVGGDFPFGTLTVNIVGSLVMGILVETFATRFQVGPEVRSFLTTGFLGGFTTFSAFSLETVLLLSRDDYTGAMLYVLASVALSVGGLLLGMSLVRAVT
ncbi:MAG: fluoride efflux transporter CrcB [Alphaproteobacteria bacterium]|nr:fluoride efflux transporter CrcB [Alphaproteobacteria bacterium]